jgi:hypothetical protein
MVGEVIAHREGGEELDGGHTKETYGIVENGHQSGHESRATHHESREDVSMDSKRDDGTESRDGSDARRRAAGKKVQQQQQLQGHYAYPAVPPSRQPSYPPNNVASWGNYNHSYGHPGSGYAPHPHQPHQHYHPHHQGQMPPMPPYGAGHYSGPPMGARGPSYQQSHYGNPYPIIAAAPYAHSMPPQYPNMQNSDSASISSKGSKGSKKRTIDGLHDNNPMGHAGNYAIRRTDSSSSATSTVTAGNNTSSDSHLLIHDSPHSKRDRSHELPHLNMGTIGLAENQTRRPRHHHREFSADASTTSSLSVGLSLASYDGPRGKRIFSGMKHCNSKKFSDTEPLLFTPTVGNVDDSMMSDSQSYKSKRMKGDGGASLIVETGLQIPSVHSDDPEHSSRFEHLSIEAKGQISNRSESSQDSRHQSLFLSLSTSPINGTTDVDATPISKNTTRNAVDKSKSSIFKPKGGSDATKLKISTSEVSRDRTPPVHGELGDILADDHHNTLTSHLRGQSFTPLNADHPGSSDGQFIAPQLSWSIAGDAQSVGDLVDWDDDKKSEAKIRPTSSTSQGSRNMPISPRDFQLWKEEHEMADQVIGGATTPLPAFFESHGNSGSENHMNYESKHKHPSMMHPGHMRSSHVGHHHHGQHMGMGKPMHPHAWSKPEHHSSMPPTPMYSGNDYRDNAYTLRSPYGDDRRDGGGFQFFPHPSAPHSTDRVRNLRGRMPPNAHHFPPMLHIPPPMSTHLPMTSPMALPAKSGLWSPHGNMGRLASPHHLTSPLNSMTLSKRKCVPLKPPIPSKFQGDIDQVKNVPVPEFTSLVNFPVHMSQKQSVNLPEGMRCCVMCGQACPCSNGNKSKKKKDEPGVRSCEELMREKSSGYAIIPTQNKGLCTLCDVNVWVVVSAGLEIKWCKGCKNFRPWAAFGDKGLATKCLRCRDRQREKYALQKEEKEKTKAKDKEVINQMGLIQKTM